jgi:DNA-binding transcriptional LysR family regulator
MTPVATPPVAAAGPADDLPRCRLRRRRHQTGRRHHGSPRFEGAAGVALKCPRRSPVGKYEMFQGGGFFLWGGRASR